MKTATDDTQETLDRTAETLRLLKAGFDVETARREAGAAVEAQAEAKRAARRQAQAKRWERLELEAEAKRKAFVPPPPVTWGESMCNISCPKCGNNSDAGEYWNDALGFPRPRGEMQCPRCHWAVRREWKNGDIRLTPTQPTL